MFMENNNEDKEKCECGSGLKSRPFRFCGVICDGCQETKAYNYLRMLYDVLKRRDDDVGTGKNE